MGHLSSIHAEGEGGAQNVSTSTKGCTTSFTLSECALGGGGGGGTKWFQTCDRLQASPPLHN